jgi:hypothetical protein
LLVVALDDEVPDDDAPAAFPAALREEEAFGEDCVLCGEQ